jgi:hypothetical protein
VAKLTVNTSLREKGELIEVPPFALFENGYVYQLDDLDEDACFGDPLGSDAPVMEDPRIEAAKARAALKASPPVGDNGGTGPTKAQLLERAAELGIQVTKSSTKAELQEAIDAAVAELTEG